MGFVLSYSYDSRELNRYNGTRNVRKPWNTVKLLRNCMCVSLFEYDVNCATLQLLSVLIVVLRLTQRRLQQRRGELKMKEIGKQFCGSPITYWTFFFKTHGFVFSNNSHTTAHSSKMWVVKLIKSNRMQIEYTIGRLGALIFK